MINLFVSLFISVSFLDIIDVLLVAFIIFELYMLMKGSAAINIFLGLLAIYLFWKLAKAMGMELLSEILGQFAAVGIIVLIVVFQREIRQFLLMLGTPGMLRKHSKGFNFLKFRVGQQTVLSITPISNICQKFSINKTGALIVIARRNDLNEYINTGEIIDSKISEQLIENIFYKNSPLHDGAIIIRHNRIVAARCVLPVSRDEKFPVNLGLRHRSALGISEMYDAIAIVVSEQTGEIAYSKGGNLFTRIKPEALSEFLESEFN